MVVASSPPQPADCQQLLAATWGTVGTVGTVGSAHTQGWHGDPSHADALSPRLATPAGTHCDASPREECVRVVVRIRPLTAEQAADPCPVALTCLPQGGIHVEDPLHAGRTRRTCTFDAVIPPAEDAARSQAEVFSHVEPLVSSFIGGCNATVLAYGQTGAGKTYTMGNAAAIHSGPLAGVIPRALEAVFDMPDAAGCSFSVSFLEIYNESLRDLLCQSPGRGEAPLTVREGADGAIHVAGATPRRVRSAGEALQLLSLGDSARATAATQMNEASSRSHSIFTLHLQRAAPHGRQGEVIVSKFHMVDLAGSERNKRTGNTGSRFKESVGINSGLLALGNVISALSRRKAAAHVPYRDSRLTRLLQDSLGGTCRTVFIACVSPARVNVDETLNTLAYAGRARSITNTPVVNRGMIEELQRHQAGVMFGANLRRRRWEADDAEGCPEEPDAAARAAEAEQRAALLHERVLELERELCEARSDLRADEGIFEERLKERKALKRRALAAERENEALREQLAAAQSTAEQLDAARSRLEELAVLCESQRQEIEALRRPPPPVEGRPPTRPPSVALGALAAEAASPDSADPAGSAAPGVARTPQPPCPEAGSGAGSAALSARQGGGGQQPAWAAVGGAWVSPPVARSLGALLEDASQGDDDRWSLLADNVAGLAAATEDAFDGVLPHCVQRRPSAAAVADAAVGPMSPLRDSPRASAQVAQLQQQCDELARESYYYRETNKRLKQKLKELAEAHGRERRLAAELMRSPRPVDPSGGAPTPAAAAQEYHAAPGSSERAHSHVKVVERDVSGLRRLTADEIAARRAALTSGGGSAGARSAQGRSGSAQPSLPYTPVSDMHFTPPRSSPGDIARCSPLATPHG
eukprot:TRINITY_DN16627_c0_g1_i1.p1 TRINITY_DN16627_c0_g1~~TRINITY_DN16627_c0_g1_i1.p1  ORF type:complete len:904 (+),score=274.16 TRINITY_DN16627_c0_g1_i1:92-2713(+)